MLEPAVAAGESFVATDLGTLPGDTESTAAAVNDNGQVVGVAYGPNAYRVAFSWTAAGGMVDLGTFPGGYQSQASAVNDVGQVVGTATGADGAGGYYSHAFSWTTAGGMVDLGILPGRH